MNFQWIKCLFGYHNRKEQVVYQTEWQTTANYTCECGDTYGATTFGPMTFEMPAERERILNEKKDYEI